VPERTVRAVILRGGLLRVGRVPEPVPGPGQLLVAPIATGVCGSDLSAWQHTEHYLAAHLDAGVDGGLFDPAQDLVLGHEFTSRVVAVGDGVTGYAAGDKLVTLPWVRDSRGVVRTVGYSNDYPGGLAERAVVQAGGHLRIPDGVDPVTATVTEPLATGVNAVLRSRVTPLAGALVTGAGPVGLGAVALLAEREIHPLVVSDPSPQRRALAMRFGADQAVDPAHEEPVAAWRELAERQQRLYVFEASGRRGLLNELICRVPQHTCIFVAGACMELDVIRPVVAVMKNIAITFLTAQDWDEDEYTAFGITFERVADGRIDAAALVTGYAGFDGVPGLFAGLRPVDPHAIGHVKVLVRPELPGSGIYPGWDVSRSASTRSSGSSSP
jgi:threonine dehydrogenase-like Zn-dependent dehydrogenase